MKWIVRLGWVLTVGFWLCVTYLFIPKSPRYEVIYRSKDSEGYLELTVERAVQDEGFWVMGNRHDPDKIVIGNSLLTVEVNGSAQPKAVWSKNGVEITYAEGYEVFIPKSEFATQ